MSESGDDFFNTYKYSSQPAKQSRKANFNCGNDLLKDIEEHGKL
jgi:hypothetical protein